MASYRAYSCNNIHCLFITYQIKAIQVSHNPNSTGTGPRDRVSVVYYGVSCVIVVRGKVVVPDIIKEMVDEGLNFAAFLVTSTVTSICC